MTRLMVEYGDLLGIRHLAGALELRQGALDCAGTVAEVIRRAIGPEARDAFLGLLRGEGAAWTVIADGKDIPLSVLRLGDVVTSTVVTKAGEDPHVSAVVSLVPPMVLTSSVKLGVFATRLSAVTRLDQVLRYPGRQP